METYSQPVGQEIIFSKSRKKRDAVSVHFPLEPSSLFSLRLIHYSQTQTDCFEDFTTTSVCRHHWSPAFIY